jgi:hypothetical protein
LDLVADDWVFKRRTSREEKELDIIIPFESADDVCDRFLALLQRLKINPPIGSGLEDEILSASDPSAIGS